ncbi:unnamed protein product [Cylindrotheca closterium]|uniref:Uncharacterized protein n=1 Tax=Cylindrotheca closterium TaxID=2856 RepID=A0AAD2FYK7_9STRA|nr:unnamed protein product [Cylindrotheca closterium]
MEQCAGCQSLPIEQIRQGHTCNLHSGHNRYWRCGNVAKSKKFLDNIIQCKKYAQDENHHRYTIGFLPAELRNIRDHLIAQNSLPHLMLWTMMILASRMYLRVEEVRSLKVEDFLWKYFVIRNNKVTSLMVKVKGKRDKGPVNLLI